MRVERLGCLLVLGALAVGTGASARAELPPLIPRDVLFGNPERTLPQISPDGKRLGWLAPDKKNVLQVWVKTIGKDDDKMVTGDKKRGIRQYLWAQDNQTLLYLQDSDGDENYHVYGVNLDSNTVRDYTPFQGIRAIPTKTSPKFPNTILVSVNLRDRRLFDVYRVDLASGATTLDTKNPGDVAGFLADDKFVVRGAQVISPQGGTEIRIRADAKSPWKTMLKVGPEENLGLLDFAVDGRSVYLQSSIGSDTARVVERNLSTGAEKEIAKHPDVDAGRVLIHPTRHVVQAVAFVKGRQEWRIVDPGVRDDFAAIARLAEGDFFIINRDLADQTWLLGFTQDRGPVRFYSYDRKKKQGTFLFAHQPKLDGLPLAEMKPAVIPARDGLALNSYLTLPVGLPSKNLPMVLYVHGGPWARDNWGYEPTAQWLANRGYAVLQVNYRGSTGFGKKFLHAADHQFGLAMHDDLIDAVNWAIGQGLADPKRVAIMGGSYGGYAALAGAAFTPDVFRCSVDIVGPSNLATLIKSFPPYAGPALGVWYQRAGNPSDPKDAEILRKASPLFSAHRIKIPLLVGQGANDPRVKQAESEQIVAAIEKNGGEVTYVVYPDEGHGFARPENRIDFNARAERFLAAHLGGRFESLPGAKIPGSTGVVKEIHKREPKTAAR